MSRILADLLIWTSLGLPAGTPDLVVVPIEGQITSVTGIPCTDYLIVAARTQSQAGKLHVVDFRTARVIRTLGGHKAPVVAVAATKSSEINLVSVSDDRIVNAWASRNFSLVSTPKIGRLPSSVSMSQDGKLAVITDDDDSVLLLDPKTGKRLSKIKLNDGVPLNAVISPDGSTLAVTDIRGRILLSDLTRRGDPIELTTGSLIGHVIYSSTGKMLVISCSAPYADFVSPNGPMGWRALLESSKNLVKQSDRVLVWDAGSKNLSCEWKYFEGAKITCMDVSPDEKAVAVVVYSSLIDFEKSDPSKLKMQVYLSDIDSTNTPKLVYESQTQIRGVVFSRDGRHLAIAKENKLCIIQVRR